MKVKYSLKQTNKRTIYLFTLIVMLIGFSLAAINFKQLQMSIITTIGALILVVILFIINKKNYKQIQIDELGFKDNQRVYYYQDIEAVICDLKQIIIYYPAYTLTFTYNQKIIDVLINQGIQIKNSSKLSVLVLVIGYFLEIYFFYHLFVLLFGGFYCLNYDYQVINYLGLFIRIIKLVSIAIVLMVLKKFQNKQIVLLLSIMVFGASLVGGRLLKLNIIKIVREVFFVF